LPFLKSRTNCSP
ncbi:hypothetical protein AVEN_153373-1, partial [Araneus ventricosus]